MANFRENFLGHIRPAMCVKVYLLSYANQRFRGRVQGVGLALYQNNGRSIEGLPQVEETLNWVATSHGSRYESFLNKAIRRFRSEWTQPPS